MRQFILTLCIFAVLLVVMVQADFTLEKRARQRVRKTCSNTVCPSGRICVSMALGASCAVLAGKPCSVAKDLCEGGYYCPQSGFCSGSGRQKKDQSCANGELCDNGLYCDRGVGKCLEVSNSGFYCYGDTDCKGRCTSIKGCYCSSGTCVGK